MHHTPLRKALNRGVFHITAGSLPAIGLIILPRPVLLIVLASVTVIIVGAEIVRLLFPPVNEWFFRWFSILLRQEEKGKLSGASYMLLGYLITVLLSPVDIAIPAILFTSLGDSAATLVGIWKGKNKMWGKSIEGNIACLAVCLAIGVIIFITTGKPAFTVILAGAVIASIVQALPLRVNDNITICIISAAAMTLIAICI